MGTIYKNSILYGGGSDEHVELTQVEYDALSESEKKNGKVYFITDATGGSGGEVKLWAQTIQLSGEETRQLTLPSGVFAFNIIFSNTSGFCDNYTHFGNAIGARSVVLRNSATSANCYIYLSTTGELTTNTSATGVQLHLQALYFEK